LDVSVCSHAAGYITMSFTWINLYKLFISR
jgi:hypothetical protein